MTTTAIGTPPARNAAPWGRVLGAELRWVLRRPRNMAALLLMAALPVVVGTTIALTGGPGAGDGPPALSTVAGNGLVLPVATMILSQTMLLPLVAATVAADALAGEASHGTLRGLLLAPVSRVRVVLIKALGVLTMIALSVGVMALSGVLTGLSVVGGGDLVTLSGTTLPFLDGLARVAMATLWVIAQMAAVGAIALALSSMTEHPVVVLASTMGIVIVFGVLGAFSSLSWLHPFLVTTGWTSVIDVLRDPVVTDNLAEGLWRAGCYVVIGVSVAVARMATKDS